MQHYNETFLKLIIDVNFNIDFKHLKNLKIFMWKKRRFRLCWDSSPGLLMASNPSTVESVLYIFCKQNEKYSTSIKLRQSRMEQI